jgi:hypothetical protein
MTGRSQKSTSNARAYEKGQRLYCQICHTEIEIINPRTGTHTPQVLQCCGRDMTPEVGVSVNLDD